MRNGSAVALAIAVAFASALGGCGGSSSGAYAGHGTLLSIEFPDPTGVSDPTLPPDAAPLLQQIVLKFDGSPDPNSVSSNSIAIRDDAGFVVPGSFAVDANVVTFTPRLPTVAPSFLANGNLDAGDAGFIPGRRYTIRLSTDSFHFIGHIYYTLLQLYRDPTVANGILMGFGTTTDVFHMLDGLPAATPTASPSSPEDGATGVSPNLYTDPDQRFAPRAPIVLLCDKPIRPDPQNLGPAGFQLIDLDDRPAAFPYGIPLGVDVRVTSNTLAGATLEMTPGGILPFGHQLALVAAPDLQGVSEHGNPTNPTTVVTTFTIADPGSDPVNDALVENFDDAARHDQTPSEFGPGSVQAEWDVRDSQILQAGLAFEGNGVLGQFTPPVPKPGDTSIITLDTTRQVFPLPDGSTPDAPPNYEVLGGVFSFTDVDIPAGVWIEPIGSNPLVITATGSFRLAGEIFIQGIDGTSDYAFDSAVASLPGGGAGSGGGRGGDGHPIIFFPPDQISFLNLVSPPYGGRGWSTDPLDGVMKQIGGTGGQSGIYDHADHGKFSTDQEISCDESLMHGSNDNGSKPPGGGGGSMLVKGQHPFDPRGSGIPLDGIGNVIVDGQGKYIIRKETEKTLFAGDGGDWPFYDDGDSHNNFIGPTGQVQRLIGGQGGGAGGSRTEGYFCGVWCRRDTDTANDGCCNGSDFTWHPKYADSVGDARGAAGGGGGGALLIQSLGPMTIDTTGRIHCQGGNGGGGESIGTSNWGSSGGGGSGGAVLLQSGTSLTVKNGARIDVSLGQGATATKDTFGFAHGAGGNGSVGIIQLQVPAGQAATVENSGSIIPANAWVDPQNVNNPAAFTPQSIALSTWWDLGRTIARPPLGATPSFVFSGLDAYGFVPTDADGYVINPRALDVVCDDLGTIDPLTREYLPGREPRSDYIPPGCSVRVEFQGGDAIVAGSSEVDPTTLTNWAPNASIGNGHQFIRWRVTFTIADTAHPLGPFSPRPVVQSVTVHSEF